MEGHDFEYAIADLLRHNGYRNVSVTQGSGDFGIDILARRKNVKYAIQCKRYKSAVGVKAVQEAGLGTDFYHCDAAAVITNSTFTKQAKTLAETTGVRLWGREFLEELVNNYDDEYDKLDPQIAQAFVPRTNIQSHAVPTSSKIDLKQLERDKGILLAKDIYVRNGKIHYFNRNHTYKQAKQDRVALLGLSWVLIVLSICSVFVSPFISLFGLGVGIWGMTFCKKIKQALYKYNKLKEEKIL